MTDEPTRIEVPREGVNDDTVRLVAWLVADGEEVEAGAPVVEIETTKSAVELAADAGGFVFHQAKAGTDVAVGSCIGLISRAAERPGDLFGAGPRADERGDRLVTAKARALIAEHGLSEDDFAGLEVVRAGDVLALLAEKGPKQAVERRFRDELLDLDADWDAILSDPRYQDLVDLLTALRKRMKARYDRHVGVGDLLHDRWELAREYGFGEGASVYDDCLILGEVTVGAHSWVGPGCILDGQGGGLVVGHHVDIGAGSHLYTHNTVERALTGHRAPIFHKPTRIGDCCFLGPRTIIAPGTVIGDHCFVAAGSYVEGVFADHSFISGNPAKQVGTVEITGDRARLRPFPESTPGRLQPPHSRPSSRSEGETFR